MKLRLIENKVDDEYNKFYSDIDRETFDSLIKLDPKTVVRDGEIVNAGFGAKQLLIAKWRGGDKTILDKGEEITDAFNKFYANMKSYPAQYKNIAAYASVDDFIKYVNGEEVEAQEIVKENPIDIIYNKYYKDIDREDFNKIIALDPKTSEDKIGEVARDLLLANYKKGEKNFIDDDQLKDAIKVFYDDFNKLSKENQQLKNYLSIEDFKTKILAGDETDFERSLKNNQTIDPNTHRPVSEDAVIVGSTRNYTII